MKIKISFLFICFYYLSFSQVTGSRFVPDASVYKESGYYLTGGSGSPVQHYFYSNRYVLGDTIINNKYYQKMFTDTKQVFDTVCLGTKTLLYHENRRVYVDTLLIYDFNLNFGDTFNLYLSGNPNYPAGYYKIPVTVSDSVNIGSWWRKRLTLYRSGMVYAVWVEGIGDINRGFNTNYSSVTFLIQAMGTYNLVCFSEHFQNIYGTGCGAVSPVCTTTAVENHSEGESELLISPQPASDALYIQSTQQLFKESEPPALYDLNGRKISLTEHYVNTNTYKLDVNLLDAGMYVIVVKTDKGWARRKLLVGK